MLNDSRISRLVELALMEDIGLGDLTSESIIPDERLGEAEFLCKEDGIIAGLEVVALTMQLCDSSLSCEQTVRDGGRARRGQVIARV
ncbi:MAG: nicotinate-nucleotide diphosphorylase (carboxylating), partial [Ignavibacteria bacterium]|nr:nicotinate-nucleotide diphosphorylase (carboxylating) [Ignavibacteria bacterium]